MSGATRRSASGVRAFTRVSPGPTVPTRLATRGVWSHAWASWAQRSAIDRVRLRRDAVIAEIAAYGETDLLCYRAESPESLAARQDEAIRLIGPERYRMWLAYLAGVTVGFEHGPLRVFQTVATKQGAEAAAVLPPTRDDLYRADRAGSGPM